MLRKIFILSSILFLVSCNSKSNISDNEDKNSSDTIADKCEEKTKFFHNNANYFVYLNYMNANSCSDLEIKITYNNNFKLPIASRNNYFFKGWYTEEYGKGIRFTDESGIGLKKWEVNSDINLYAYFYSANLNYELNSNGDGYVVSYNKSNNNLTKNAVKLNTTNEEKTEIIIPNEIQEVDVIAIKDNGFNNIQNIENIVIPDSIIELGKDAFVGTNLYNNTNLNEVIYISNWAVGVNGTLGSSVSIKNGTHGISNLAFSYQYNLAEISLPNSLKYIGSNAFMGTAIFNNTPVNEVVYADTWAVGINGSNPEITIKPGTVGISAYSFTSAYNLVNIYIPESVKYIERQAFLNALAIENFYVDPKNNSYVSENGILFTKNYESLVRFPSAKDVTTFYIPKNMNSYEDGALAGLKITEFTVDDKNKYFYAENGALFSYDKKTLFNYLKSRAGQEYIIPNEVENIGRFSFRNINSLAKIVLPNTVKYIGPSAFSGCINADINIPESVETIDYNAFGNSKFWLHSESNIIIHDNWVLGYKNYMPLNIPEGIVGIAGLTFNGAYSDNLVLPSTLKYISPRAFERANIINITIPKSIEYIGKDAFYLWNNYQTITINKSKSDSNKWNKYWNSFCEAEIIWNN